MKHPITLNRFVVSGLTFLSRVALGVSCLVVLGPSSASAQCPLVFSPFTDFPVGSGLTYLTTADFNGDRKTDIAAACTNGRVYILLGDGSGGFGSATNFISGNSPVFVAAADLNGDGKVDLAVANEGGNNVSILVGTGTGSFGEATIFSVGDAPNGVAVGDFNEDGKPDLAVATAGAAGGFSVLIGAGTGAFGAATNYIAGGARSLATGDFNGDGHLDLATGSRLFLGTGTGLFGDPTVLANGSGLSVIAADFNGDGNLDVAALSGGLDVAVLLGNGIGDFGTPSYFQVSGMYSGPNSLAAADFNGDGNLDLAVSNLGGSVAILLGTGTGSFGPLTDVAVRVGLYSVAIGDFDSNGRPDLAVSGVTVLLNAPPYPLPAFTQHPASQLVPSGSIVSFSGAANGVGAPLSYRWRRNGVSLTDGGTLVGASTATLTLNPAADSDMAVYDLQATSPAVCGYPALVVTSNPAVLAVTAPRHCVADLGAAGGLPGHDGFLDNNDFIAFINAFFSHTGCP